MSHVLGEYESEPSLIDRVQDSVINVGAKCCKQLYIGTVATQAVLELEPKWLEPNA